MNRDSTNWKKISRTSRQFFTASKQNQKLILIKNHQKESKEQIGEDIKRLRKIDPQKEESW